MDARQASSPTPSPSATLAIRGVVFDMDGLIFNTETIYDQVGKTLLARRGAEFTWDLKRQMMGRQNREALEIMRRHCGLNDGVDDLAHESNLLFLSLLPTQIQILPGFWELIDWLEQRKIPKAVATSSSRLLAQAALGHFDLWDRFQFVLTGDDVTRGKPDPEIYLRAAHKLSLTPAEILVLEDSVNGTKAAVEAGAVTVAIPGDHATEEDFLHVKHKTTALNSPLIFDLLTKGGIN